MHHTQPVPSSEPEAAHLHLPRRIHTPVRCETHTRWFAGVKPRGNLGETQPTWANAAPTIGSEHPAGAHPGSSATHVTSQAWAASSICTRAVIAVNSGHSAPITQRFGTHARTHERARARGGSRDHGQTVLAHCARGVQGAVGPLPPRLPHLRCLQEGAPGGHAARL
jgi:hypothetical protein